jgi:hypothetical protein
MLLLLLLLFGLFGRLGCVYDALRWQTTRVDFVNK